jgi:hypothetical protein
VTAIIDDFVTESMSYNLACTSRARFMTTHTDVEYACDSSSGFCGGLRMRSNIICSFAAVFAVFTQFAAVFVAFALPVPATADQPAGPMATVSATQEQSVREVPEVIVESRRAI